MSIEEKIYDVDVRQVLFNMEPEQALSGRRELRGVLQKKFAIHEAFCIIMEVEITGHKFQTNIRYPYTIMSALFSKFV